MSKLEEKEQRVTDFNCLLSEFRSRERGYVDLIEALRKNLVIK
jgi:hypothetical protein